MFHFTYLPASERGFARIAGGPHWLTDMVEVDPGKAIVRQIVRGLYRYFREGGADPTEARGRIWDALNAMPVSGFRFADHDVWSTNPAGLVRP